MQNLLKVIEEVENVEVAVITYDWDTETFIKKYQKLGDRLESCCSSSELLTGKEVRDSLGNYEDIIEERITNFSKKEFDLDSIYLVGFNSWDLVLKLGDSVTECISYLADSDLNFQVGLSSNDGCDPVEEYWATCLKEDADSIIEEFNEELDEVGFTTNAYLKEF